LKKIYFFIKIGIDKQSNLKIRFMNQKFTTNKIENDDFLPKNEDCDYKDLIIRLKEIGANISLLEKIILR
tara:strand:+ start:551 stop:760 length:210 start_codon:yes stop_codon:yes gene_type:complete